MKTCHTKIPITGINVHLLMALLLSSMLILAFPIDGHSITTMSIQFQNTLRLVSLDMPRKEIIETLGVPDIIKSEGMCLQYEYLGLSIFLNRNDQVEQIYLARNFKGTLGNNKQAKGINLSDIEKEFGSRKDIVKLNYQPSPSIQTKATTETENNSDPTGREKGEYPLQYPGNKKLYMFYNRGEVLKYKYVDDEEGIAFWMDHNQQLYATVLYTSRGKNAIVSLPAVKAKPAAPEEKKVKVPEVVRLPIVHFDFDKYNIKKLYIPELDQHIAYLKQHSSSPVTVEGHTDSKGTDEYNQKLSERRANIVRQYLIEKGIASSRIQVVGYGERKPIADNNTEQGRAINRRAEFEVTVEKMMPDSSGKETGPPKTMDNE
ncbi:MAG: OmpA family protein [Syntrophales bacterium LBB04]|nr:OmpA family protein [Syntrophales bacterium LBB04]